MKRDEVCEYLALVATSQASLRFCERFDEKSRIWNRDRHAHPYIELIFFLEGHANIDAGAETIDVRGFDLVIYPPGLVHAEHLELGRRQEIVCLWADVAKSPPLDRAITLVDDRGTLRELFLMTYTEFMANRPFSTDLVATYLRAIFLLVLQHYSDPNPATGSLAERCLGYIHENYARDFTIEDLAAAVSVSPSYLYRLFKRKTAMSPMRYRNVIRIDKAKLLLVDPALTVDVVAERVGFRDPKYFARVFKALVGSSPSAFRRAVTSD